MKDLYSIGEVAAQTGLSVDTIRVWERRYGRPQPVRLPSGHRRYAAEELRWLRRVAEALHLGHRPGRAVRASEEELSRMIARSAGAASESAELQPWMTALRGLQLCELRRLMLAAWSELEPTEFFDQRLAPFLVRVGRAWADGELGVRHEHIFTEVATEVLRDLQAEVGQGFEGPPVLLATIAGERHVLGVRMAALLCALRGLRPVVLGVDLPESEILRAVQELRPRAVAISVSLAHAGRETERRLAALARELPADVPLVAGGRGLGGSRRPPAGVHVVRDHAAFDAWLATLPEAAVPADTVDAAG